MSPFITAAATGVIAVLAIVQCDILKGQLAEMKEERIGNQRAWITARGAEIVGPIKRGGTMAVEIIYGNTGKQPAMRVFNNAPEAILIPVQIDERGTVYWERMELPRNETCEEAVISSQEGTHTIVAFGGQEFRSYRYIFGQPGGIPEEFLEMERTVVIQGCLAYESLRQQHWTAYCFFIYPRTGITPDEWKFRLCPSGNYTDERNEQPTDIQLDPNRYKVVPVSPSASLPG